MLRDSPSVVLSRELVNLYVYAYVNSPLIPAYIMQMSRFNLTEAVYILFNKSYRNRARTPGRSISHNSSIKLSSMTDQAAYITSFGLYSTLALIILMR